MRLLSQSLYPRRGHEVRSGTPIWGLHPTSGGGRDPAPGTGAASGSGYHVGPETTPAAAGARAETTDGGGMGEATTGKLVLALDTGTTSGRALVIDASGVVLASAQQEVAPRHAARRLGGAGRGGALAGPAGHRAGRAREGRSGRLRGRRHRHREPARDHHPVGPGDLARRSRRRSSGRTGGPPASARSCASPAPRRWSGARPGSSSTRTSRAPRSAGCWTTSPACASARRPVSLRSAPWTAGWPGGSAAAAAT